MFKTAKITPLVLRPILSPLMTRARFPDNRPPPRALRSLRFARFLSTGGDNSALQRAHSDDTDSDGDSHDVDGCERFYYLTVPSTAVNCSILAGLGRGVWRVCV